jgi:uncharacterized membrane protein YqjE
MAEIIAIDNIWDSVRSDNEVGEILRRVAQNPQDETVDVKETRVNMIKYITEKGGISNLKNPRMKIIGVLNKIFYVMGIQDMIVWLYENQTRLKKMISASLVLEGENLRSFGAKPQASDIPQSLLALWNFLSADATKNQFERLSLAHTTSCKKNVALVAAYTGEDIQE